MEACGQCCAGVGFGDEEGVQWVGGFVVQGYVVDGDLRAEDAGHVVDGAELGVVSLTGAQRGRVEIGRTGTLLTEKGMTASL